MDGTYVRGGMGYNLMAFGYIEVSASVICTCLRAYGARTSNGKTRWDFIWVALATTLGVAALVPAQLAVKNGLANHLTNLPNFDRAAVAMKWFWIAIFIGLPAMAFAKFSIIALLLNVQGPSAVKRASVLYFLGFLIMSTSLIQIPLTLIGCSPVERLWDIQLPGNCDLQPVAVNFGILQGSISAFADVVLALWPISIVWHLNTSMRVKIGFCAVMAVGILPAVASVVRTTMLPGLHVDGDVTYTLGTFLFWASAECMAVIVLGSIPPLRPLFLRMFYGVKTTVHSSRGGSRNTPAQSYHNNGGLHGNTMMTNLDGGKDAGIHLNHSRVFSDSSSDRDDQIFVTREVNVEKYRRARVQEV